MTDHRLDWPRIGLTGAIVLLFYYAMLAHWSNGLEETLKNVMMLSVGFWLGSSKGATDSGARADKALDIAASAQASGSTPDVTLQPGETAQAAPRAGAPGDYAETGK